MIVRKLYVLNVKLKKLRGFIKESFTVKMEVTAQETARRVEAVIKAIIIGKYIQNLN